MAIELHLDVELHRPATFFLVQRLKSKLGEVLMLVLSSFLRVPRVSALVPEPWPPRRQPLTGVSPHAVADRRRALLPWAAHLRPPSAALRPPQGSL